MVKHYCDSCQSLIKDGELWKITIERNDGCISCLQPYAHFKYDICPTCAAAIKQGIEQDKNTAEVD